MYVTHLPPSLFVAPSRVPAAKIVFSVCLCYTSPMLFFAMRKYVLTAIGVWYDRAEATYSPGPRNEHVSNLRFYSLTIVLFGCVLAPALFLENFGSVLAFTGSFASSMLGYIMPAALFFRFGRRRGDVGWNAASLLNGVLFVFGLGVGVLGTVQIIQGED